MATKIIIIDYGVGNLLSVHRAVEFCGFNATISSDTDTILDASHIILAGVGAFKSGMSELKDRGLVEPIMAAANRGTPFLGICLGMQMLMERSEEFGSSDGLGIIPGEAIAIPKHNLSGEPQKTPHIGWNGLYPASSHCDWKNTILEDIKAGESAYFVHSFMVVPKNSKNRLANCDYGGHALNAVVIQNNVVGCQFHPEKSGKVGLKIFKKFLMQ
jgi:imidazole glycerol-phosphate synthase subunit HisH